MKEFFYYTPSAQQLISIHNGLVERLSQMVFGDPEFRKTEQRLIDYNQYLSNTLETVKGKHGKLYLSVPRVTIMGSEDENGFSFTVSRCSANDSFSKSTGKTVCKSRLNSGKVFKFYPKDSVPTKEFGKWFIEQSKTIAAQVVMNSHLVK